MGWDFGWDWDLRLGLEMGKIEFTVVRGRGVRNLGLDSGGDWDMVV